MLIDTPSQLPHFAAVRAGTDLLGNVFTLYGEHGRASSYFHGLAFLRVEGIVRLGVAKETIASVLACIAHLEPQRAVTANRSRDG